MSRLSMSMSHFKKISSDKHSTTLQHKDGHKITIAHNSLAPKYRAQLAVLKMADGGAVPADSSNQVAILKENTGKKKPLEVESEPQTSQGGIEYEELVRPEPKNPVKAERMAKGGEVNPKLEQSKLQPPKMYYADGGEVDSSQQDQKGPVVINVGQPQMNPALLNPNPGSDSNIQAQPRQLSAAEQATELQNQPYGISPQQLEQPQGSQPAQLMSVTPNTSPAPQSPISQDQQAQSPSDPYGVGTSQGMFQQGLQGEQEANTGLAQAQGALGEQQAKDSERAVKQEEDLRSSFQQHMGMLQEQEAAIKHDIAAGHIDPDHYMNNMSTGSRIAAGIGLILGGIGGEGKTNIVADHLNHMIDQDIAAQQNQLGRQENLLSINLRDQGNLRDATELTRMQTREILMNKIQSDAQKAQSPLAQQQAALANAKLQKDNAQAAGQFAARKAILGNVMNSGKGLSQEDPARAIQFLVPPDKQIEVSKEIKRAQDTRTQESDIMSAFDKASKDMKGLGRISSAIKTPRSLMAFEQSLQPTFGDIEGTVRQSAMDATKANVNPDRYDTDADTAIKRQALETYIHSKKSAPLAKTYGLDIDKYKSTAPGQSQQPQYKTVNGVKYMRGPDGKAIKVQ